MTTLDRPATATSTEAIERRTQAIGRQLFRRLARVEGRGWAVRERVEGLAMRALMRDEGLKYRLLRFVDVYPSLRSASAISAHLEEYLESPRFETRAGAGPFTGLARAVGRSRAATRPVIGLASRVGIETMGRQFIAGDTPRNVAPRLKALERRGFGFSLDLLGEFVASESQADEFARRYLDMIESLETDLGARPRVDADVPRAPGCGPRLNVSIKLSALTSKFDPMDEDGTAKEVLARLRPIVRAARRRDAFVNIDMEKYEYRGTTLDILRRLLEEPEFAGWPHIGTVMQAYLVDAPKVLDDWLSWLRQRRQPMTIRLVKGAYWDSEQIWARQRGWPVPVLTDKRECDAQFERLTRRLLENADLVRTAIASHNLRSIAHALAAREGLGVPREQLELQMLYGMAGPIAEALRGTATPVRVYVPCGELVPGMAYLVRRILENTANDSFLRLRFAERRDAASLLVRP